MKKVLTFPLLVLGVVVLSGCADKAQEVAQNASDVASNEINAVVDTAAEKAMDAVGSAVTETAGEMMDGAADMAKGAAKDAMNNVMEDMGGMMEKTYTVADVAKHNTPQDCWTIVDGTVADVTSFFGVHPGGDDKLAQSCGVDATPIWKAVEKHDPKGYAKLKALKIGVLAQS